MVKVLLFVALSQTVVLTPRGTVLDEDKVCTSVPEYKAEAQDKRTTELNYEGAKSNIEPKWLVLGIASALVAGTMAAFAGCKTGVINCR